MHFNRHDLQGSAEMADSALKPKIAITLRDLTIKYGATTALSQVSINFTAGQLHAVVGENGAGKSSLLAALMGVNRPTAGKLRIVNICSKTAMEVQAGKNQIGWMRQQGTLLPQLSVLANFALAQSGLGKISWSRLRDRVDEQLRNVGVSLDTSMPVANLSHSQRQLVEFARLQWLRFSLLLLDEPTAQMSKTDAQQLMKQLRAGVTNGQTVIITGHRLAEVWEWADQIHILRHGKLQVSAARGEITKPQMLNAMFGEVVKRQKSKTASAAIAEVLTKQHAALEINGLKVGNGKQFDWVFDLQVCAGEIVAMVGLPGDSAEQLMAILCGLEKSVAGTIKINGQLRDKRTYYEWGIRRIPASTLDDACIAQMNVAENLLLHQRRSKASLWLGDRLINWSYANAMAMRAIHSEQLAVSNASLFLAWLSGGNQRKLLIARELLEPGSVIVAQNIDAGLDMRANKSLANRLCALRDSGSAILLLAYDYSFVSSVASRVLVMNEGVLAKIDSTELPYEERDLNFLGA